MAVTGGGTPYVESTDLVANYPATSLSLANKVDTKVDYALPVNAQTGTTYTFVLADGLRLTTASNAASSTYTVPPQSSVVWLANSVIRLVNYGAGVVTVAGGSGVTVTNAAKTLAQYESVALIRTGSDDWTLVPFSGGVGNADFSDAATGTYSDGGINYKYKTYTASGTLTVTRAGVADVIIIGGGGGGGRDGGGGSKGGGGGAGGWVVAQRYFMSTGTLTITIGAGGAAGTAGARGGTGTTSSVGTSATVPYIESIGGGGGSGDNVTPEDGAAGASGGGGGIDGAGGVTTLFATSFGILEGRGQAGVAGTRVGGNPGGQGGGAGQLTSTDWGSGRQIPFTPISATYFSAGGNGNVAGTSNGRTAFGDPGAANTGAGGGGSGNNGSPAAGAGGSGVVIIRVRTN